MIVEKCGQCNLDTYYIFTEDNSQGCINRECKGINWELYSTYIDKIKSQLLNRLGFCGCGMPEKCLIFVKDFLDLKIYLRLNKEQWECYETLRIVLFNERREEIMWIIEYLLDDKNITSHGGNASGSWIEDHKFKKFLDIFCTCYAKENNED